MVKGKKAPTIVPLAILTVLTVVFWIAFSVYEAFVTEPQLDIPAETLADLDPTLDSEALTILDNSIYISDNEVESYQYGQAVTQQTEEETDENQEVQTEDIGEQTDEESTTEAEVNIIDEQTDVQVGE